MRRIAIVALLAVGSLMVGNAAMAARPGTEQQLVQQLNGQPVRWILPDGGRSGIFTTYDGGTANNTACMTLAGARAYINGSLQTVVPNVLLMVPIGMGLNLCIRPGANSTLWDGGCNLIPTDENFGVPVAAGVPQYVTPDALATRVCATTDAGYLSLPIWWAQ